MKAVCTIIARNYLAAARCWAHSIATQDPQLQRFVLVIDGLDGDFDRESEPFSLVQPDVLSVANLAQMQVAYSVTELSTALKPFFLNYLLQSCGVTRVCYFDPDIFFYSAITEIWDLLDRSSIVLTPHQLELVPVTPVESELALLKAGIYNLGFLGLAKTPEASRFLRWWQQRLSWHCKLEPQEGMFVDQRWIDLVPGACTGVEILRDPGCNVAYWNIRQRSLRRVGSEYFVGESPLKFFHFSGYNPFCPEVFSKHDLELELEQFPACVELFSAYRERLLSSGYKASRAQEYGFALRLEDGTVVPDSARKLWRRRFFRESAALGYLSYAAIQERLRHWLLQPACSDDGMPLVVTNFALAVYLDRADIRKRFPDIHGADKQAFAQWFQQEYPAQGGPEARWRDRLKSLLSEFPSFVYSRMVRLAYRSQLGPLLERMLGERGIRKLRNFFLPRAPSGT